MAPATEGLAQLDEQELAEAERILRGAITDRVLGMIGHAIDRITPAELDTPARRRAVMALRDRLNVLFYESTR